MGILRRFREWIAAQSDERVRTFREAKRSYQEALGDLLAGGTSPDGLTAEQRLSARRDPRLTQAEGLYLEAIRLSERERAAPDVAIGYYQLGLLCHIQGRLVEAARAFQAALKLLEDLPKLGQTEYQVISGCHFRLGLMDLEAGKTKDARRGLTASLEIDVAIGDIEGQGLNRGALARCEQAESRQGGEGPG